MIIKVLLVSGLALAAFLLLKGPAHRQLAMRRLGALALAAVGVVAVIWPGLTVRAAQLVGVRRGTDLVLYLAVLGFTFLAIAMHQRIGRLENQLTLLTRELALRTPNDQAADPKASQPARATLSGR